jgi:hypothetical protein
MIEGFPRRPSVFPGEELLLHVATDAPRFRVEVHRWGARATPVARSGWLDGADRAHHLPFHDWGCDGAGLDGEPLAGWPAHPVPVPADWPPGVYVAVLVEDGGPPPVGLDARHARALFVVRAGRAGRAGRVLYKVPLLTYHAYNQPCPERGWCLYTLPDRPVPRTVSVRRPGGGVGGTPWDVFNVDPFDPTPRQTFAHWDAPFVAWAERHGHRFDYCTDLDLHHDPDLLDGTRLLVSAGHDEYWSDAMRNRVEAFVARGGNVAFFAGNVCWWRVEIDEEDGFHRVAKWSDAAGPDRPENALTGVSFRNGGERDRDDHPVRVGYRVQHADHWVFGGTGLRDGDVLGGGPGEYLVGYEADGAHFDRSSLRKGLPVQPTGDDGTPADFTILGVGDTRPSGWGFGNCAATMGLYERGGTVFTAATTDWARLLAAGSAPVERITANVLDRLG